MAKLHCIVSFTLGLAFFCALGAKANQELVNNILWTYTISNGNASLGDGYWSAVSTSTSGAITIPSKLGNYPVTEIGYRAFADCRRLSSVTIPDSVTIIGDYAFNGCTSLTSVTIPDSVTIIGDYAFTGCSKLPTVTIPDSVTSIGDYAFYDCTSLTSVTIPGSVTSIRDRAFFCCSGLKSVTIPDSVTSIGKGAFCNCSGLKSVTIPDSVTSIGDYAFSNCERLSPVVPVSVAFIGKEAFSSCREIEVATGNMHYTSRDGVLYDASMTRLMQYPSAGTNAFFTFPSSVRIIDDGAFKWANLYSVSNSGDDGENREIRIPEGIEQIGDDAFYATRFYFVRISPDFGPIYAERSLADGKLVLPTSLRRLGSSAFAETWFTSIEIGALLQELGNSVFPYTLTNITVSSLNSAFQSKDGVLYSKDMAKLISWPCSKSAETYEMPDSVRTVGYAACSGARFSAVQMSKNLTTIDTLAFNACSRLSDISFPDSLTYMKEGAFQQAGVRDVVIPSGVEEYHRAFLRCAQLTNVVVEAKTVGEFSFAYCTNLESVNLRENVETVSPLAFDGCTSLKKILLPDWFADAPFLNSLPASCQVNFYSIGPAPIPIEIDTGDGFPYKMDFIVGQPYGELPEPAPREGWTFRGWFTGPNGTGRQVTAESIVQEGDNGLYAYWLPTTYTVNFSANGGTGNMAAQAVARDKSVALSANKFTKSGCTFLGWAKTKTGKVAYANKTSVKNLAAAGKSVTLYAQWAVSKYAVKFNANGGTLPKGKKMAVQTMTYGKAAALRKNVFTRSGYVFLGWAKTKTGAVAYKNGQSVKNLRTDGKATTLYAVWAKKTYKVAFYANGGTGKMAVESFTYGKAKKLTANKFKAPKGKKFAGWATSAANAKAGKVAYKNAQAVKNLVKNGGTVKLYAVWKKK